MNMRDQLLKIMQDALEATKARHPYCRGPFIIRFPEDAAKFPEVKWPAK